LVVKHGTNLDHHDVPDPPFRKLGLRIFPDIAAKLPELQILKCSIGGDEHTSALDVEQARYTTQDWPGPRRDSRHDFGKALRIGELARVSHLALDLGFIYRIYKADSIDQRLPMPDLVKPAM
jgi:hypothetical protein